MHDRMDDHICLRKTHEATDQIQRRDGNFRCFCLLLHSSLNVCIRNACRGNAPFGYGLLVSAPDLPHIIGKSAGRELLCKPHLLLSDFRNLASDSS